MKSEGLGLFRARKKNNGEWLEGYYCRALETAEHGSAVYHFIIFQKADGSGRVHVEPVNPDTLCRCTGVRDRNGRLIFENDFVQREIGGESMTGTVVWSDIGLTGFFLRVLDIGQSDCIYQNYPISRASSANDGKSGNDDVVIGIIFYFPL